MKLILRSLKYILILIIVLITLPYLICPSYEHPDLKPFSGNLFYNPYENLDSSTWIKSNFHAHTMQWMGLTAARTNHVYDVVNKYKELKYDIIGISDYQSINRYLESEPLFIPVYEHGYGIFKNHQLVIGSEKVSWYDFLFFQSFSNMQDVIQRLKNNNTLISVNHPKLRNAYPPEKLKYLRGYDLIEVVNHGFFDAVDLWDTVLSNGNAVFGLASDDNHDINNPESFGFAYNMINSIDFKEAVIKSLAEGKFFAVELEPQENTSPQNKLRQANTVPVISLCKIIHDTLRIRFNKNYDTIKLTGQNGFVKKMKHNNDSITYVLEQGDTYIRAEICQKDLSKVFLNPIFRYNGEIIKYPAVIDNTKTWIYRAIYFVIALIAVMIYVKMKRKI